MSKLQRNFEKIYVKAMGWEHIPNSDNELVYVDIKKYKGKTLVIDGVTINNGDTIAEMHIDNLNISKIDNTMRSVINSFKDEMTSLTKACNDYYNFRDIKAVYGVTVLHPLLKYLEFTIFPLKSTLFRLILTMV